MTTVEAMEHAVVTARGDPATPIRQLSVRCHPIAPVSTDELDAWLERLVDELRAHLPQTAVRLSRLTQTLPSRELGNGWLVDLTVPERGSDRLLERVREMLGDMRLLGLRATLLAPREATMPPSGEHAIPGEPASVRSASRTASPA